MVEDFERCYRAVQSRDSRFDGWFFTAVSSTHIYCRPSCPAITPKRENVSFFPTAAAAQQAGYRACLRCRPDAAPGSPEWLGRKDVASRAVKLVMDGIVDREGVSGLAQRLNYGERQLHRLLISEVGTGALSLARAQRAQTARLLLETTGLPVAHVAFGAGFSSVRQFNDTVKQVFGRTPSELRRSLSKQQRTSPEGDMGGAQPFQTIALRLAHREPFAAAELLEFLGARAVSGLEYFNGNSYSRSLRLPFGQGSVELTPVCGFVRAVFHLSDIRDLTTAVTRARHLLNLDSDPLAVDEALQEDPLLRPFVRRVPGRRVPGSTDGFEIAVRATVGQQISVSGARKVLDHLVTEAGTTLAEPLGPVTHEFPSAQDLFELASRDPRSFAVTERRRETITALASAVASETLIIDPGADSAELERRLHSIPGVGPWTSSYITMRALGDPDAFLPTDLGLRRALAKLGRSADPQHVTEMAQRWRPWRAYAMCHLWSVGSPAGARSSSKATTRRRGDTAA